MNIPTLGITRNYEPSQDLTLFYRLKDINIIITKDLRNPVFQNLLLQNKGKIILHVNVTGWGSTPVESKIPHPATTFNIVTNLINQGFPKNQMVLRIDPIIPNETGLNAFELVLSTFAKLKIQRCRISLLRLFPFIQQRVGFLQTSQLLGCPYYSDVEGKIFQTPSKKHIQQVMEICSKYESEYNFEYCDLNHFHDNDYTLGCISNKDLEIMGYTDIMFNPGKTKNDKSKCSCPGSVIELMQYKKQCNNHCLFCARPSK